MGVAIILIHGRGPYPRKDTLEACWKSFLPPLPATAKVQMIHWTERFEYTPPLVPDAQWDCGSSASGGLDPALDAAFGEASADQTLSDEAGDVVAQAWGLPDVGDALAAAKNKLIKSVFGVLSNQFNVQFAKDIENFFLHKRATLRDQTRDELVEAIRREAGQGNAVLVVAHSFGSIVAYEALREFSGATAQVHSLITLGSPLAWCYDIIDDAKPNVVPAYADLKAFPARGAGNWWNVLDPEDPIVMPPTKGVIGRPFLGMEYGGASRQVIDCVVRNLRSSDSLTSHHDWRGYLEATATQKAIRSFLSENV